MAFTSSLARSVMSPQTYREALGEEGNQQMPTCKFGLPAEKIL